MSVTYLIRFELRPGQRERFLALLTPVLDAMRKEDGFVNATLHVDLASPDRFLLHETWRDHDEVVAVQIHRPYRRAWHEALPSLLAEERAISVWTPLRADHRPGGGGAVTP